MCKKVIAITLIEERNSMSDKTRPLTLGMKISEAQMQMRQTLKGRGSNVASLLARVTHVLKHNYGKDASKFVIERAWVGKGIYRFAIKYSCLI
jgi:ribosomal protein L22